MDQVVQANAGHSQQTVGAASEIDGQAERLGRLVADLARLAGAAASPPVAPGRPSLPAATCDAEP